MIIVVTEALRYDQARGDVSGASAHHCVVGFRNVILAGPNQLGYSFVLFCMCVSLHTRVCVFPHGFLEVLFRNLVSPICSVGVRNWYKVCLITCSIV